MIENYFKKEKEALQLNIRKKIYLTIEEFPGVHFRELQRKINLGTGNLSHHLDFLEKINLIEIEKSKGNKRYYPLGLSYSERNILGVLRQKKFRKVVLNLLQQEKVTHKKITDFLKISPSSVTWYIGKLIDKDILIILEEGKQKYYKLKNKEEIIKALVTYRKSFVDTLVDNFVEVFEKK